MRCPQNSLRPRDDRQYGTPLALWVKMWLRGRLRWQRASFFWYLDVMTVVPAALYSGVIGVLLWTSSPDRWPFAIVLWCVVVRLSREGKCRKRVVLIVAVLALVVRPLSEGVLCSTSPHFVRLEQFRVCLAARYEPCPTSTRLLYRTPDGSVAVDPDGVAVLRGLPGPVKFLSMIGQFDSGKSAKLAILYRVLTRGRFDHCVNEVFHVRNPSNKSAAHGVINETRILALRVSELRRDLLPTKVREALEELESTTTIVLADTEGTNEPDKGLERLALQRSLTVSGVISSTVVFCTSRTMLAYHVQDLRAHKNLVDDAVAALALHHQRVAAPTWRVVPKETSSLIAGLRDVSVYRRNAAQALELDPLVTQLSWRSASYSSDKDVVVVEHDVPLPPYPGSSVCCLSGSCFGADNFVTLINGSSIPISEVLPGTKIRSLRRDDYGTMVVEPTRVLYNSAFSPFRSSDSLKELRRITAMSSDHYTERTLHLASARLMWVQRATSAFGSSTATVERISASDVGVGDRVVTVDADGRSDLSSVISNEAVLDNTVVLVTDGNHDAVVSGVFASCATATIFPAQVAMMEVLSMTARIYGAESGNWAIAHQIAHLYEALHTRVKETFHRALIFLS